jgi:hypothetical protein
MTSSRSSESDKDHLLLYIASLQVHIIDENGLAGFIPDTVY